MTVPVGPVRRFSVVPWRARLPAVLLAFLLVADIGIVATGWFGLLPLATWQIIVAIVTSCFGMLPLLLLVRNELRSGWTELETHADGLVFRGNTSKGCPPETLTWAEIARIDLECRIGGGVSLTFLRFPAAAWPGSGPRIVVTHLSEDARFLQAPVWTVIEAVSEAAAARGWALTGPRRANVPHLFTGMNWRMKCTG